MYKITEKDIENYRKRYNKKFHEMATKTKPPPSRDRLSTTSIYNLMSCDEHYHF